jgi:hypothetical protein
MAIISLCDLLYYLMTKEKHQILNIKRYFIQSEH